MLKGKAAVVTGSTSGIGLGLAEAFAASGCRVALNGIASEEEAGRLAGDLVARHNTEVFFHRADLADPEQCVALIRDSEQRFGAVDILVNNAGIQHVAPVDRFPPDRWDAVLAVNVSAAFHTTRAALPGMRTRDYGRILNIASVHGLVASVDKCAYVTAKHGLVGLTKAIALENAATGITCNAICPGFVLTPLIQQQIDLLAAANGCSADEAARRLLAGKHPTGRFTRAEDIAELALFLCGPAAANITGACLPIDGGWTAQ